MGTDRAARRRERLRALSRGEGRGVHHIAVASPKFDELVAAQTDRGKDLVLSGTFSGFKVAYLATEPELGVIVEIFNGPPDDDAKPNATSL